MIGNWGRLQIILVQEFRECASKKSEEAKRKRDKNKKDGRKPKRRMEGEKDTVKPSSRFALFTAPVCSLSPYKQITDTGLKPMRHIIIHKAPCQHHMETAKYNIVPQKPD